MSAPDNDQDDAIQQRVIKAAEAPPLRAPGASSVFNWRGSDTPAAASEPATTDPAAAAAQPPERETMATSKKRRARKSSGASPQFQICTALMAHGDLERDELLSKLDGVTRPQFASALNNAKSQGRIVLVNGQYRVTKEGKDWATGGANLANQQAAEEKPARSTGKSAAHRRGRRRAEPKVDTSPPDAESTFRCAVMSDGAFFISKGDDVIELDAQEHRQMLAYLERMAEAA